MFPELPTIDEDLRRRVRLRARDEDLTVFEYVDKIFEIAWVDAESREMMRALCDNPAVKDYMIAAMAAMVEKADATESDT